MPVLLAGEAAGRWLDVRGTSEVAAAGLLQPSTADDLEMFRVGLAINDHRHDAPEVQVPQSATTR